MTYSAILTNFFLFTFGAVTLASSALAERTFWDYGGVAGPENWSNLTEKFSICGMGDEQSPIDLAAPVATDLRAIDINWSSPEWTIMNTGHTIQGRGANTNAVIIDGEVYELMQFHFRTPSEHAINGVHAPMEVQFVHQHEDGHLAVIGVLMEGGGTPSVFDAIMANAPAYNERSEIGGADIHSLLPRNTALFRYQGSLTTPPCSEIVLWSVFSEPVKVSDSSIKAFEAMFEMNARPLQAVNRRFVLGN